MRISQFSNRQDNSARIFILLPKKVNSKRIFVLFSKYMLQRVQSWTILLKVMNEMETKNSSIFSIIAKGSCGEVRSQIIRASDVSFIDQETAKKLYNDCISLNRAISAFIKSLKQSNLLGTKYLKPET